MFFTSGLYIDVSRWISKKKQKVHLCSETGCSCFRHVREPIPVLSLVLSPVFSSGSFAFIALGPLVRWWWRCFLFSRPYRVLKVSSITGRRRCSLPIIVFLFLFPVVVVIYRRGYYAAWWSVAEVTRSVISALRRSNCGKERRKGRGEKECRSDKARRGRYCIGMLAND